MLLKLRPCMKSVDMENIHDVLFFMSPSGANKEEYMGLTCMHIVWNQLWRRMAPGSRRKQWCFRIETRRTEDFRMLKKVPKNNQKKQHKTKNGKATAPAAGGLHVACINTHVTWVFYILLHPFTCLHRAFCSSGPDPRPMHRRY